MFPNPPLLKMTITSPGFVSGFKPVNDGVHVGFIECHSTGGGDVLNHLLRIEPVVRGNWSWRATCARIAPSASASAAGSSC